MLTCALARPAWADFVYTFNTTSLAPLAGPASGSFRVADSAILDGFLTASEITSYGFIVSSATPPFAPATFAAPDPLTTISPFAGAIRVDPATGRFQEDAIIQISDSPSQQTLSMTVFSPIPMIGRPAYEVQFGGPFGPSTQGRGEWTVQRPGVVVPKPSTILLACAAGICGLVYQGARRRSRPAPTALCPPQ
jgi:hypothetical protein